MKKRLLNMDKSERPKKRPRTQTSHSQIAVNSINLLSLSDNRAIQLSDNTLSTRNLTQSSNRMRNAECCAQHPGIGHVMNGSTALFSTKETGGPASYL